MGEISFDEQVSKEHQRIKSLFAGADDVQAELLEGAFVEAARIRCEIDKVNADIQAAGGRVRVSPANPAKQRVIPAARELDRLRASYLGYMTKLSKALGVKIDDDEDELGEYE